MSESIKTIAILGGTGDLGGGLARQWSRAGYAILIGSRTLEKGQEAAAALLAEFADLNVTGLDNASAAEQADLVVLTVPFAHQLSTLDSVKHALAGKVLIDVTVPLMPPKVGTVQLPEAGSAGQQAQNHLGKKSLWCQLFRMLERCIYKRIMPLLVMYWSLAISEQPETLSLS